MAYFQNSVTEKYLKTLDKQQTQVAYIRFKSHFHNSAIQENIRNSKEEQYQEGFLRDLFVSILGYTLNPNENFNLTTEYKNVKDAKKADGAIIIANKVLAVIELKGTDTTDLNKVENQAFSYKNNQSDCQYIVTSNFEKLRFYIDNAIEHLEFNLFTLTEKEFELLYLCLSKENIEKGIPKKIKDESLSEEDLITKNLYKDYSLFKRELYHSLVELNPEIDELLLFKKSQKLLDRFLFLFFAEDRQLLPPNSVRLVVSDWRDLQDKDENVLLYSRFKKYFGYLNTGFKGKRYDVFAYNGGLFKPDDVLDIIKIDDELLYKHTLKLSDYDFASDVDVNILGHIFENSLNELDEIKAQLEGQAVEKSKTKRKKDGVFYTPKYITKYIVENTVGRLCEEKKVELQIVEEEYTNDKKRSAKLKQNLYNKLLTYREWLLQITICDPACGSGAFLNQALDFLIIEHRYIDELQAKLFGDALVLSDVEKSILENNLFGVDINEESVEIAKLSLWLRTAQPNRKLNDLNNNIKCGNSLIDDSTVAGDKTFNWEKEFPQVFGYKGEPEVVMSKSEELPDYLKLIKEQSLEAKAKAEQAIALSKEVAELSKKVYEYAEKLEAVSDVEPVYGVRKGGFDVVIGNPPYTYRNSILDIERDYFKRTYNSYEGNFDLYKFFIEKIKDLSKPNGLSSFIVPNTFLSALTYKKLRELIITEFEVIEFLDLGLDVFEDVVVESLIFTFRKCKFESQNTTIKIDRIRNGKFLSIEKSYKIDLLKYFNKDFTFNIYLSSDYDKVIGKCQNKSIELGSLAYCTVGINTGYIKNDLTSNFQIDNRYHKMLNGKNIGRNIVEWDGDWILYDSDFVKSKGDKGRSLPPEYIFTDEKILIQRTRRGMKRKLVCYYDHEKYYNLNRISNVIIRDEKYSLKFIYTLLNSELLDFYFNNYFNEYEVKPVHIAKLPIKILGIENQQPFIDKADQMLSLNKDLQEASKKLQRAIQRKFEIEELPNKLQNWYLLTFKEFIAELGKKKVKLTLTQEAEWEDYFLQEKQKAVAIKNNIEATDKEIDRMVYELYELTEEEIKIVER